MYVAAGRGNGAREAADSTQVLRSRRHEDEGVDQVPLAGVIGKESGTIVDRGELMAYSCEYDIDNDDKDLCGMEEDDIRSMRAEAKTANNNNVAEDNDMQSLSPSSRLQ